MFIWLEIAFFILKKIPLYDKSNFIYNVWSIDNCSGKTSIPRFIINAIVKNAVKNNEIFVCGIID